MATSLAVSFAICKISTALKVSWNPGRSTANYHSNCCHAGNCISKTICLSCTIWSSNGFVPRHTTTMKFPPIEEFLSWLCKAYLNITFLRVCLVYSWQTIILFDEKTTLFLLLLKLWFKASQRDFIKHIEIS